MARKDRLKEVYEYVRDHYPIHSQSDFADALKYNRAYISSAMHGNAKNLTDKLFRNICEAFPGVFNLDYLLTGEGELLAIEEEVANDDLEKQFNPQASYADKLIASLEKQVKDKDDQLADKERIIKLLEMRIEELEAMQHIDAENPLRNHHFPIGVAEHDQNQKHV